MAETTALGAAIAAGGALGVEVWDLDNVQSVPSDTFSPTITQDRKYNILQGFILFYHVSLEIITKSVSIIAAS